MRFHSALVVGVLVSALLSLAACGGGGGSASTERSGPVGVTSLSPGGPIPSEGDQPFLLSGWGFGMTGEFCQLRFTATSGTPFSMGTSATLMAEGIIEHTGNVRGIIDPPEVPPLTGPVLATLEVLLPNGTTYAVDGHTSMFAELVYNLHITAYSPHVGEGGELATFVGTGFMQYNPGTPTVWFGANAATGVTVQDDRKLTCVVPAGIGTVAVRIENTFATTTAIRTFSYSTEWSWDSEFGAVISSSCDDCSWPAAFDPTFSFPFYGTTYNEVYAATNGSLTFGGSWTRYRPDDKAPVPQIAMIQSDQTTYSGAIHFKQLPTMAVITYEDIPHLWAGPGTSTYQVQLRGDGAFAIMWRSVGAGTWTGHGDSLVGWTGITPGTDAGYTEVETDFNAGPSSCVAGEALGEYWYTTPNPFDLEYQGVSFVPNAQGGYDAAPFVLSK